MPRRTHQNSTLPSARQVSTQIHRPSYSSDPNFTVMLAVFGQFLDHDITATALNQGDLVFKFNLVNSSMSMLGQDGEPIDCCDSSKPLHPECFSVDIGPGDPNYEKYNITCMNFIRSAPAPTGRFGPRQQLNQATAFIDGSVVYGATDKRVQSLRSSNCHYFLYELGSGINYQFNQIQMVYFECSTQQTIEHYCQFQQIQQMVAMKLK